MSSEGLLTLAKERFRDDWTAADETLFRAIGNGEIAYFGDGDPAEAAEWDASRALQADRIVWLCTDREAVKKVTHRGVLIQGARIEGELDLSHANIGFPLVIIHSAVREGIAIQHTHLAALVLNGSHTGPIQADNLRVEHALFMRGGFHATGEVRLLGATIGGDLDCSGGTFSNPKGNALFADGVRVEGNVFLRDGFQATGTVRLLGAVISGDFSCGKGNFSNPDGKALGADRMTVAGGVFLNNGFRAMGEVRFSTARIGGNLDCCKGTVINPEGSAIDAGGVEVEGSVALREKSHVVGEVSFTSATVKKHFIWRGVQGADRCSLRLTSAKIGTLWDEEKSWPAKLYLDGLVYDRIHKDAPLESKARRRWLKKQHNDEFMPQPYAQLASVLSDMGHEVDARRILIAKQKDPARVKALPFYWRAWHHLLGVTIGYGYRPWQALLWIALFIAVGTDLFNIGDYTALFVETKAITVPTFNAFVYSVDTFVPLVDLHQAKYWLPTVMWLQVYHWIHIGLGWVLSSLLVVGLTGLVRK